MGLPDRSFLICGLPFPGLPTGGRLDFKKIKRIWFYEADVKTFRNLTRRLIKAAIFLVFQCWPIAV